MKGILGRKVGMTQVSTKDGRVVPVTVVAVEPNVITQVKTVETDGYNAIQLATVDNKEKNATKASIGHAKKANTTPTRYLKEIRDYEGTYNLGDTIIDRDNNIITQNTLSPVPFIILDKKVSLKNGKLSDIAPTILKYMDIAIPKEMKNEEILIQE